MRYNHTVNRLKDGGANLICWWTEENTGQRHGVTRFVSEPTKANLTWAFNEMEAECDQKRASAVGLII